MFLHNFKYSLKTLFRNRMLIFWTFAFPIILGTFFNMAFADISKNEKLDIINIAIVKNEDYEKNEVFKNAFEELSDENSENRMFNTQYVNLDEAKDLLENDKIVGYLVLEENEPKLTFKNSGINETIFKYVTEEIIQITDMTSKLTEAEIKQQIASGDYNIDADKIVEKVLNSIKDTNVEFENTANSNFDMMQIEFYTLIAMTCLYGGALGMIAINQNLPNISNKGKRVAVAPTKKGVVVFSSLLAGYVAQLVGLALLFAYSIVVLNVDFGTNIGLVILTAIVGSFAGLSLGVTIGTLSKRSENTKTGILISITMAGSFFAGMMGVTMKYVIDKNIPILNHLNPANMITDSFYALYYYNTLDRFWFDIACLLIFSAILIVLSFIGLRRQKYDSI